MTTTALGTWLHGLDEFRPSLSEMLEPGIIYESSEGGKLKRQKACRIRKDVVVETLKTASVDFGVMTAVPRPVF